MSVIQGDAESIRSLAPPSGIAEPHDAHPPTHPALTNFDILKIVFQHFKAGPDSDESRASRHDLYQAAQTCRSFLDPALDSLWMSMDTLLPLLRLLPALELLGRAYVLCGSISNHDVDRLNWYARRIKSFHLKIQSTPDISPLTYIQLAQSLTRSIPLLPSLRTLHAPSVSQLSLPNVAFVLSPSLERVDIEGLTPDDHIVKPFFSALGQRANGVQSLTLRGQMSQESSRLIMQFNQLTFLEVCDTVPPGVFSHIGALPYLESLIFVLKQSPPLPSHFTNVCFPKLKHLRIDGPISTISSYYKHFAGGPIETMVISASSLLKSNPVIRAYWESCFSTISNHFRLSLCSLHLIGQGGQTWFQTLLPHLSTLLKLKSLRLQGQSFVFSQVLDLAQAVHGIHELHLPLDGSLQCKYAIPLSALGVFAESCPDLKELQIQVDLIELSSLSKASPTLHGLHTLIIDSVAKKTLDVDVAPQVASYIDRLFPRLQSLRYEKDDKSTTKFWAHVDQIVRVCQVARQHERVRAAGEWFESRNS
ncbi:hypothetical protein Hypma_001919 [Hypsizygus marmoreus]|uniref:F-box domain-containing protein n=1 Tax=Hypsizygus marmoreus TaxID=39966 RepID=A0A369J5H4_HYPMA|nr:hypothetical protein Hypma_001919 [Hypsizygus marmoreus]